MAVSILDVLKIIHYSSQLLGQSAVAEVDDATASLIANLTFDIETNIAWVVGKGYGATTVDREVEIASRFVSRPNVVFDVGANVGKWSRAALTSFPGAKVYAYEPQAAHSTQLGSIATEFPERFFFQEAAVSDREGEATIFGDHAGSALSSLHHRNLAREGYPFRELQQVKTVTIQSELTRLGIEKIDVLKIDVEGHELSVLKSAGDSIRHVDYIQFEFGGTMIDSRVFLREFIEFFEANNFRLMRISPIGLIPIVGYKELYESFVISNYIALNRTLK